VVQEIFDWEFRHELRTVDFDFSIERRQDVGVGQATVLVQEQVVQEQQLRSETGVVDDHVLILRIQVEIHVENRLFLVEVLSEDRALEHPPDLVLGERFVGFCVFRRRHYDAVHVDLHKHRQHRMQRTHAGADLLVYPVLNIDIVFGERPGFEELMYAVYREEPHHGGAERVGDWDLDRVRCHHLLGEDLLGEDLLHPGHVVVSDGDLHAESCAH
jgi:hypothetical protein